ncbi:SufS family cysteine desulfurase [Vallitaleaceae bacterium 9-2]
MHKNYHQDFPVFEKKPELIYLDSAASSLRPYTVVKAMKNYGAYSHANIHRGAYALSYEATKKYEAIRKQVATWIGAKMPEEVIFTQGTTDSINHLVRSFESESHFEAGKKIVLSIFEHHSNLVPWQQLAKKKNMRLEYLYDFSEQALDIIDDQTQIVAITLMSNAVGLMPPISKIIKKAHAVGALVVGDAAQYMAHYPVNVDALDIDFLAFSGHKLYGPTGIGVLYGKHQWLTRLAPPRFGGDMIEYVAEQETTFAPLPNKFEAGTPNIDGVIGLGSAIEYILSNKTHTSEGIEHMQQLRQYAFTELGKLDFIQCIEPLKETGESAYGPIISFVVKDVHPHDVASILDQSHIAIRAGHHCAQPLMKRLNLSGTCRISFSIYNTTNDIDALIVALKSVRRWLGYES